ncbi:MAG: response regulator [Magnetococcales bacterium]|nr:response regulator [Magnetococcales bacterium]
MMDTLLNTDKISESRKLVAEILDHVTLLVDSDPNQQQRGHLTQIRLAAQRLESYLQPSANATPYPLSRENPNNRVVPPLKILLAEDNPFTQKLMSRLLSQNNHQVEVVDNGQAVLEKLQLNAFDLILMDIRMPIMDGIATTEEIRNHEKNTGSPKIPIIAITTLVGTEEKERILESGVDGYHGKPVRAKVLQEEMLRVLNLEPAKTMTIKKEQTALKIEDSNVVELDMNSLLKTVDNDWSLIQEITDLFFSDAPKQIERIQKAIDNQDSEELLESAHSLKGAAGAFGKNRVYDLAYELEQLGRSQTTASAQERTIQLTEALSAMEKSLRTILSRNGDQQP